MHYKINNILIQTEKAAKSIYQPKKSIIDWINGLPQESIALDYGCGKLRYTIPLSNRVKSVYGIDSPEQLNRIQKVVNDYTTVIKYVEQNLPNTKIYSVFSSEWKKEKYDVILCSNVLSAIPEELERIKVLENIYNSLKEKGQALIINQYRNHYFRGFKNNPQASMHLDGWLVKNLQGASFYGIIPTVKLRMYLLEAGFKIVQCKTDGESAFALISV